MRFLPVDFIYTTFIRKNIKKKTSSRDSTIKTQNMNHQTVKIYNEQDFKRITRGIKVAQCMRIKSAIASDSEKVINQLDELVVSKALSCSFCNTIFEDKTEQRLHYKLDWHRYNLKQNLRGLKFITEEEFSLLVEKDDVSSLSGSEQGSENEEDSENGSPYSCAKSSSSGGKSTPVRQLSKAKKSDKKFASSKVMNNDQSDTSDGEGSKKMDKKDRELLNYGSRHSKVFFENEDGDIFSIYRCLLHNKKDVPEIDNQMISQALQSGEKALWTVIMVGGGHFAGAVFQDGEPIVHKTFHSYTVRAKQGFSQTSRDNRSGGSHPKSAGASLRRYKEASFVQHVQDILESWSTEIANSTLILFRAVGPYNRAILFGGKSPPFEKGDTRLRALPFPTRRATFDEIKRVYDILTNIEIYGLAANFVNSFPISPRQPNRKKSSKSVCVDIPIEDPPNIAADGANQSEQKLTTPEKPNRTPRVPIDRAKPRKSPHRPLPDIVAKLARSSSESDLQDFAHGVINNPEQLVTADYEVEFSDHLKAFEDTVPRYLKNKKIRQQKRKTKKDRAEECRLNEVFSITKVKLWSACQRGEEELYFHSLEKLMEEIKMCDEMLQNQNLEPVLVATVGLQDLIKLVNDQDADGNTMLHLASINNLLKTVWSLLELGSDPCVRNKKLQTPYVSSSDKKTRNIFRKFMGEYPDKYNYNKSQIPGPLNDEIERQEQEKRKEQKKAKREREKVKKKEFEIKKQEETVKQTFLQLSDREKRALAAEKRMQGQASLGKSLVTRRCFQCGSDLGNAPAFEYCSNQFCSMPCLKEHRLHSKFNH